MSDSGIFPEQITAVVTDSPLLVQEGGVYVCEDCGWNGAPTFMHGKPTMWCPRCQSAMLTDEIWREGVPRGGYVLASRVRTGPKVGRNEPCPCGSGAKAKKCGCGAWAG